MAAGGRRWRLVRASGDAVPARVRRFFMARQRRLRDLALRRRRAAAAAVVVVTLLLAGWLLWGTSLLGVREVRVTGAAVLSPAEVRAAAAIPEQTPLLRVRRAEVAARVRQLPPVAAVQVSRSWPGTVVIEVTEREPVAAVPAGGQFQLVDADGVVIQQVGQPPVALPMVVVSEPGPADPATRAALTVLAALTPQLSSQLETLTVVGPANIRLELFSGWTVVWGDERDSQTKAQVATALLDRAGEIMDVSAPEVVSVR
jgi:cell division protein FtsQ